VLPATTASAGGLLDTDAWAQRHFGDAQLGDRRRTRRLVRLAAQIAAHPSGSIPQQTASWKDTKAAYRLFDMPDVTFDAVAQPHRQQTRLDSQPGQRYLLLNDTTELDFGIHRQVAGAAATGHGGGRGFLLHSSLMVRADVEQVVGLAAQEIHYRRAAPKKENSSQRLARPRESEIWGRVIDQAGPPPAGVVWVHVCDRGADNFEVFCHARQQGCAYLVRVAQRRRTVLAPDGQAMPLCDYLSTLPLAGTTALTLRSRDGRVGRTATLEITFGPLTLPLPKHRSVYLRSLRPAPIALFVVQAREQSPPAGVPALNWVLYVAEPVVCLADALRAVDEYRRRWGVEEWHKALKTGCQVTQRQLKETQRLEPLVALLSVEAVRLLQLKSAARTAPERPAAEVLPLLYVVVLLGARGLSPCPPLTVRGFWRGLAQLGGFLGRRGDGEPGWQTIWRGWEQLQLLVRGYELAQRASDDG
jgi:Transposase DNA-binding/Transposase Tn5 dimerisation domain